MQNTFTGKFWMIIQTAKNHFNKLSLNIWELIMDIKFCQHFIGESLIFLKQ